MATYLVHVRSSVLWVCGLQVWRFGARGLLGLGTLGLELLGLGTLGLEYLGLGALGLEFLGLGAA